MSALGRVSCSWMHAPRRGFAGVEALLVSAILVVLIALLLPGIAKVRGAFHRITVGIAWCNGHKQVPGRWGRESSGYPSEDAHAGAARGSRFCLPLPYRDEGGWWQMSPVLDEGGTYYRDFPDVNGSSVPLDTLKNASTLPKCYIGPKSMKGLACPSDPTVSDLDWDRLRRRAARYADQSELGKINLNRRHGNCIVLLHEPV